MFLFLSKLLPLFLYPAGLATLLLIAALLLRRRARWRTGLTVAALLVIGLGGNRFVALGLAGWLEGIVPPLPPLTAQTDPPQADAILVLGGATRPFTPPRPTHELNEAGDRLLYARALWAAGAAPRIIVSGGNAAYVGPSVEPEAQAMAAILRSMGVPQDAILLEEQSRNTHENAVQTGALLEREGIEHVLLVTSAMHMPRSAAIFRRQGVDFTPAPTDYLITQADWDFYLQPSLEVQVFNLIPSADDMRLVSMALKEAMGLVVYRLRGWL